MKGVDHPNQTHATKMYDYYERMVYKSADD